MEVEQVTQASKEMEDCLRKMLIHFGDDPKKVEKPNDIEDFFKLILTFIQHFEV